jgi:hypothetical protein
MGNELGQAAEAQRLTCQQWMPQWTEWSSQAAAEQHSIAQHMANPSTASFVKRTDACMNVYVYGIPLAWRERCVCVSDNLDYRFSQQLPQWTSQRSKDRPQLSHALLVLAPPAAMVLPVHATWCYTAAVLLYCSKRQYCCTAAERQYCSRPAVLQVVLLSHVT